MSILSELYHGNIRPGETSFVRGSEYHKALGNVSDNEEKLLKVLNDADKESLKELLSSYCMMTDIAEEDKFIEGFCLGVRLIIEVYSDRKRDFTDEG